MSRVVQHLFDAIRWCGSETGSSWCWRPKGQESAQDRTKREFMTEWVAAVNEHGGFGPWACDVFALPLGPPDLLARHGA